MRPFPLIILVILLLFFFDGATAPRGGPWPPLQYAPKPLDPLLCPSIRLFPSLSGPWTRHPAISFLVFLFVLLHTAFRTTFFRNCGVLHSFYMTKPSYSLAFYKPDNVPPPLIIASNSSFRGIFHNSFFFTGPHEKTGWH